MRAAFTVKNLSLFMALASLGLALVLQTFFIGSFRSQDQYRRDAQQQIDHALAEMTEIGKTLKQQITATDSLTFATYDLGSPYSYYVFQNQKLVYWSDYREVPDYRLLAGEYRYAYRTFSTGSFVVRRDTLPRQSLEIFSLLPIYQESKIDNAYVTSGYNPAIFPEGAVAVIPAHLVPGDSNMVTYQGQNLFAVSLNTPAGGYREHETAKSFQTLVCGLIAVAIVLILLNIVRLVRGYLRQRQVDQAIGLFIVSLMTLRFLMLTSGFPYSILPLWLFDYRYFAASSLNPSLGDLLLNCLVVLAIVIFLFNYYYASHFYQKLLQAHHYMKSAVAVLLFISGFYALYLHYNVVQTIYFNSQWTLDITESVSFTFFKNVSLLIFVINSVSYFLWAHIVFRTFISLGKQSKHSLEAHFAVALGILLPVVTIIGEISIFLLLVITVVYFGLLYFFQLTKYLAQVRYVTFLYVFASALVSAVSCALVAYDMHRVETLDNKQKFANQLLVDNDVLGEVLLHEAGEKIQQDAFIKNRMTNVVGRLIGQEGDPEVVKQKIRRTYLSDYFDKYDAEIHLFSDNGTPLEDRDRLNYEELRDDIARDRFTTEYPNIFFINQSNRQIASGLGKRYLQFLEIKNDYQRTIGYIVIDLNLKRFTPNQVYPELLIDRNYASSYPSNEYAYAYFTADGTLIYSTGDESAFRYFRSYDFSTVTGEDMLTHDGYSYLVVEGKSDQYIVIASPAYSLLNIISNFSFLFLVLVFAILVLLGVYSVYFIVKRENLNFATKIQLYLNAAFFMPLLAVSVTTLSIISNSYNEEVDQRYLEKAEQIGNNVASVVERYEKGDISQESLANTLSQIARYAETDVNVFDTRGKLMVTSQPQIYETRLLSEYINPEAYERIEQAQENKMVLEESVGTLSYKSSYIGLKSSSTGQLLGMLSIPFFESRHEVELQITEVLTNMINIFTFVFIAFLIISYLASVLLTYPLKYITQKIKRTSLSDYNEPLSWESNDEIGLMVGEYNRMLVNLEASKAALARNEKESAWREMAKQVAHEIKNPLTPMKLSLQHLRRKLQQEYSGGMDAGEVQNMEKPVDNLLHQVDTLNDIASSFSSFAQMPIPKSEAYELAAIIRRTVSLYEEECEIQLDIPEEEFYVIGDKQLMGRILSNLLINAKQSVPGDRAPLINVSLRRVGLDRVVLKVSDNGTGIAKEIQHKVFMPNFSTKYAGSGIGLAIAKRGIEHAGGRITFDTQEDLGTTFFIELPLVLDGEVANGR